MIDALLRLFLIWMVIRILGGVALQSWLGLGSVDRRCLGGWSLFEKCVGRRKKRKKKDKFAAYIPLGRVLQ